MKTLICDMLGIKLPLPTLSRWRDVVAVVTSTGELGAS